MPSKLRVEMHLAIDENSSAVQRCLPLLFINIYRMVYNSAQLDEPAFEVKSETTNQFSGSQLGVGSGF